MNRFRPTRPTPPTGPWSVPFRFASVAGFALALACGGGDDEAPGGGRGGGPPGGGGPPFGRGAPPSGPTAVPVEVIELTRAPIAAFIETNGTLEAEREVDIVARIGGPIVELVAEEGMAVREGQLLARIDDAEARAQVEISRVAVADAEVAFGRARDSFANQIVSEEVFDQAESSYETAKAQLNGSEIQLGYTRIPAPFDGLIIERAVRFAETVSANQRLFRISDFDPLLCRIGVPERDLPRLRVGQPATVEVEAFPGERFQGRVLRVSPVVDAATGTIRVTLEVQGEGRLSPGMFASVRLVTDVREDALVMPKRALSLESLADSVFVVEDGAARRREVTLGYEEDGNVEVTSGLAEFDRVIVVGQDGLTDAAPVQILAGPGADETPPSRPAAGGGGPGMGSGPLTDERRAAIRERMRGRGMTDEQIAERMEAMEQRQRPDGAGRPAPSVSPAPPDSPTPSVSPSPPEAPASPEAEETPDASEPSPAPTPPEEAPPPDEAPPPSSPATPEPSSAASSAADAASRNPGPAAGAGQRRAGRRPGARGRSLEELSPEARDAIRARLRTMGLSDEEIERRLAEGFGGGGGPRAGGAPPLTAEEEAAMRERLRERGLSEEEIEARIARRRRPR